ncbi:MAG: InlB B-repeat-containing protein [Lachnospiraceae bacterium]
MNMKRFRRQTKRKLAKWKFAVLVLVFFQLTEITAYADVPHTQTDSENATVIESTDTYLSKNEPAIIIDASLDTLSEAYIETTLETVSEPPVTETTVDSVSEPTAEATLEATLDTETEALVETEAAVETELENMSFPEYADQKILNTASETNRSGLESEVTVTTEMDLVSELSNVSELSGSQKLIIIEGVIPLSNSLIVDMSHGKDVLLQGSEGSALISPAGKKHIQITNGSGTLTIQDLTLKGNIDDSFKNGDLLDFNTIGSAVSGGGISGSFASGTLILDGVLYTMIKDGGLDASAKSTFIRNTSFISNFSAWGGAAIRYDGVNTPTYISDSTFHDNSTDTSGYTGGAIHLKSGTADFAISNSAFTNCTMRGAGSIMAGGGAIALAQSNRTFSVDSSYFDSNQVLKPSSGGQFSLGTNSDGGAIYIFTSNGKNTITNSTFVNNTSYDEGGAISFVLTPNSENSVTNSTFVKNEAQGLQIFDGYDAGGAIEVCGNSSTTSNVTIEHNTFFGNIASGSSANSGGSVSFNYGTGIFRNNIASGNSAANSNVDVANLYVAANSKSGVTVENNALDEDVADVFATSNPTLLTYGNKKAGAIGTEKEIQILPIKPEGAADDCVSTSVGLDQNGNQRDSEPGNADAGAVEIKWAKYLTNHSDSQWTLPPLDSFDGYLYYSNEDPAMIYQIYSYATPSIETFQAPNEPVDQDFITWNSLEDGTGTNYQPSTSYDITMSTNYTFWGTWQQEANLKVSYDANTGTGSVSDSTLYRSGSLVTVKGKHDLLKEGFLFIEWNTSADGSGTAYKENETFTITADTTLYAQWKQNEESIPEIPIDPTEPVDPADPSEPTEPVDPADPSEPGEPTEPVDPADPSEPGEAEETDKDDITGSITVNDPDSKGTVPATSVNETVIIPKTGDSMNFWMIAVVICISVVTLIIMLLKLNKKQ